MGTYADEANKIIKRYPEAKHSTTEEAAMHRELQFLFQKQEDQKQQMQIPQPQGNQFAGGGSPGLRPRFMSGEYDVPEFKNFDPMGYSEYDLGKVFGGNESGLQFGENTSENVANMPEANFEEFSPKKTNFFSRIYNDKDNRDSYLRMGAGLAAGATNLMNRANVEDPGLIAPEKVKGAFKYRGLDLTPYKTGLANELASTRYSFMQSGADFDTAAGGVNATNQKFAGALGKVHTEEQRINNAEGARIDKGLTDLASSYANRKDAAGMFQAQRQDVADQRKRDYLAALGRNVQGMLQDESDKAYATELQPFMEQLETLKAYNK